MIFVTVTIICFIKREYKGNYSVKNTIRGFPIKTFFLPGFHVCISIVRLNRYVIKSYTPLFSITYSF